MNCPKCGSKPIGEHRDEDNVLIDLFTACGSEWHHEDSLYCHSTEDKDPGWTHRQHACSLILGLFAERRGAEEDARRSRDQLFATQKEYMRVTRQVERAIKMLVAGGMKEAVVRASLEMEPVDA